MTNQSTSSSDGPTHSVAGTTRRRVLATLSGLGIGSAVFHRALAAEAAESGTVTAEMIAQAEWIAGLELTEEEREETASAVKRVVGQMERLRAVPLDNSVPPAVAFHPAPMSTGGHEDWGRVALSENAAPQRPDSGEDLAFLPVTELAALLRTRRASSRELTELFLDRLKTYDPVLKCVVTLTEELALEQAERADRELAAGRYRGPLHGIPWGAKDLLAHPKYPTAWGAPCFRDQRRPETATVVSRLEQAGAVLVAKLSVGALAMGDRWFGGQTRNPWNPEEGSSGSSAGSAAAVVAGLVGFAIGTETLGSIISPCRRCGATGLRPTFGRVSRYGCMTLAWSMDKIGPITRSVEDCALVFGAMHGADGLDPSAVQRPFHWPSPREIRALRIGYVEAEGTIDERPELQALRDLGLTLLPIELPQTYPVDALTMILDVEAATVFDELTRSGATEGLNSWPRTFRKAEFVPAVEYLRAQRVRTLVMREMEDVMRHVDLYVGGGDLVLTNFTGHPSVVLPSGFGERNGCPVPKTVTLTGRLYGEDELLAVAHALQQATGHHLRRPPLPQLLNEKPPEGKPAGS